MNSTEQDVAVLVAKARVRLEQVIRDANYALSDIAEIERLLNHREIDLAELYVQKRYSLNYDSIKERNSQLMGRVSTEQLKAAEREVEDFEPSPARTEALVNPMLTKMIESRRRRAEKEAFAAEQNRKAE